MDNNEENEVIKESKKLQSIVITVGVIIVLLATGFVCPMLLAIIILMALVLGGVLLIRFIWRLVYRGTIKAKESEYTKLLITHTQNLCKVLIVKGREFWCTYKKDWFKYTVIILLLLILLRTFIG